MTEPEEHALPLKGAVLCSTSLTQDVRVSIILNNINQIMSI